MTLIEKLRTRSRQREQQRRSNFRSLVRDVADGKEISEDQALDDLARFGSSTEELDRAVEKFRRRRQLQDKLRQVPEIDEERKKLDAECRELTKEFAKRRKAYENAIGQRSARIRQLDQKQGTALNRRQQLLNSCDDPELLADFSRIKQEIERLEKDQQTADEAVYQATRLVNSAGKKSTCSKKTADQRLAEAKTKAAEIRQRKEAAVRKQEAIVERMIWS